MRSVLDEIIGANKDILGYNLYAYTSNNFVSSYDINGNFIGLIAQGLWKAVVGVLNQVGMKSSAEYLDRSLDDIQFYSTVGDSYISRQIKKDKNFNKALLEHIKNQNINSGYIEGDMQVLFADPDLLGSLHKVTVYYDGNIQNGQADLNITVYDKYDFKFETTQYNNGLFGFILAVGNNLAWLDQFPGIIHNYNIYISFDYDVSL